MAHTRLFYSIQVLFVLLLMMAVAPSVTGQTTYTATFQPGKTQWDGLSNYTTIYTTAACAGNPSYVNLQGAPWTGSTFHLDISAGGQPYGGLPCPTITGAFNFNLPASFSITLTEDRDAGSGVTLGWFVNSSFTTTATASATWTGTVSSTLYGVADIILGNQLKAKSSLVADQCHSTDGDAPGAAQAASVTCKLGYLFSNAVSTDVYRNPTKLTLMAQLSIGGGDTYWQDTSEYVNTYRVALVYSLTKYVPPPPPTATINSVEVTQAIQQWQSLADLKTSLQATQEPPVPIIAGKPAVLRVYFNPVTTVSDANVRLTGVAILQKKIRVAPRCSVDDQQMLKGACQSIDFYFTPPAGTWTARLDVLDSNGSAVETEILNFKSRATDSLRLRAVSICDSPVVSGATNGDWNCANAGTMAGLLVLTGKLFPTSTVTPDVTSIKVRNDMTPYLDKEKWWENTVKMAGWNWGVWDRVADTVAGRRTAYIGMVRTGLPGGLYGIADGIPSHAAIAVTHSTDIGLDSTQETLAHEIGHTLNLKHTNRQAPAVAAGSVTPPGCNGFAADSSTDWRFTDNYIQSNARFEVGFDVAARKPINPLGTLEIMGYCMPQWIAPQRYKTVITTLDGGAVTTPSAAAQPAIAEKPLAAEVVATGTSPGPFWQVTGSIVASVAQFDPMFQVTLVGNSDAGTGAYTLVELNSGGQAIFTRYFTPDASPSEVSGSDTTGPPHFSELLPVQAGVAAIAVLDPSSVELGRITLGGTAPVVGITVPGVGFVGSSQQTISWTVQGPVTFTARLLYSPDNGATWSPIGDVNSATSTLVDFGSLPGSSTALIRVLVSDGVNTGSATSPPFTVQRHQPSLVQILTPSDSFAQPAADSVHFTGVAYDIDDGVLSGTSLQWKSSIQGALGSGPSFDVTLQPGTHTITLTATDSDNNSINTTITVTIGDQPPTVGIALLAVDSNCETVTISASPGTNGASLSAVQFSLDGGLTYADIPLNVLPYSFTAPGSGSFYIVARAVDASGQTAVQDATFTTDGACSSLHPAIATVTPNSGYQGQTVANVAITGQNTTFAQGATVASFGAGITVNSLTVVSLTSAMANITIAGTTATGAHDVTMTTGAEVATSTGGFTVTTGYSLTLSVNPTGAGTITADPASATGYYGPGQSVKLTAAAGTNWVFSNFSGDLSSNTNPQSVTMSGSRNVAANFTSTVNSVITVTTDPPGLAIAVDDGATLTAPQTFTWSAYSAHKIAVASPQTAGGARYGFSGWSDGLGISHTITVPLTTTTFTATFTPQYQLTANASPVAGGSIVANPPSADGYYNSGTFVQLTATPASNYQFSNWSGDLSGATNPQSVTMNGTRNVIANFSLPPTSTVRTIVYHQITQLPNGPWLQDHNSAYPIISKNGMKAIFAQDAPDYSKTNIYSVNFDGSGQTLMDSFPNCCAVLTRASDDGSVVATAVPGGTVGSSIRVSVGGAARVLVSWVQMSTIAVSGDGAKVFFLANGDWSGGTAGLWVTNVDGTGMRQIASAKGIATALGTPGNNLEMRGYQWDALDVSHDGSKIIFQFVDWDTGKFLLAINLDGSGLHKLHGPIGDSVWGNSAAISSDGSTVLYNVGTLPCCSSPNRIAVVNFDGTGDRTLATGIDGGCFSQISADGSIALIGDSGRIFDAKSGAFSFALAQYAGGWIGGGTWLATMSGAGTRFVADTRDENGIDQLLTIELNPSSVGAAPTLTNPSLHPNTLLADPHSWAGVTAGVTASNPLQFVGYAVLSGGLFDSTVGNASGWMVDDGSHGDAVAGDGTYTYGWINGSSNTPLGVRNVRVEADSRDSASAGKRHATVVEITPFTVLPASSVTVNTNPQYLNIAVDGVISSAPQTFFWPAGSLHTIDVSTPQGTAPRYVFTGWGDAAPQMRTITASAGATYTANFKSQYQLTTHIWPAGAGSIDADPASADGYYDANQSVKLTAVPGLGYGFSSFSDSLSGSTNPQSVIMAGPRTVTANFTVLPPVLSVAVSHSGDFILGQSGATYSLIVTNPGGPTNGQQVTVTENLPVGLMLVSMSGGGTWTCPSGGNTCTRSDVLSAGNSYPAITVTVNVGTSAVSPLVNTAGVSGGGAPTATGNDSTNIVSGPAGAPANTLNSVRIHGPSDADKVNVCSNANGMACTGAVLAPGTNWTVNYYANSSANFGMLRAQAGAFLTGDDSKGGLQGVGTYPSLVSVSARSTFREGFTITGATGSGTVKLTFQATGTSSASTGESATVQFAYVPVVSGQLDYSHQVIYPVANGSATISIPFTFGTPVEFDIDFYAIAQITSWATGGAATADYSHTASLNSIAVSDSHGNAVPSFSITSESGTSYKSSGVSAPAPVLSVGSTHTGNFVQWQQNATYTVTVTNERATAATSGPITVTDTLPNGLGLVNMTGGTGWNCTANSCVYTPTLNPGASASPILVTVNVASNAPSQVFNVVSVSGGGSGAAAAGDATTILQVTACDLNRDGSTTVSDIATIVQEALGLATAVHDFNHDNAVNVLDVQMLINSAVGKGCAAE